MKQQLVTPCLWAKTRVCQGLPREDSAALEHIKGPELHKYVCTVLP